MNNYPVKQQVYTYQEIVKDLYLRDTPFLLVFINDTEQVIQTAYVHPDELLKNEKWANSTWRYIRETHEWIPIFKITKETEAYLSEIVNWVEDENYPHENIYTVTPKGF